MRSEPLRSTRTEIPEYLLSKSLATFSATGKSTDVYQTTFPSFSAAATRLGVIAVVGTASARETRDAIEPIAKAADPFRKLLNKLFARKVLWQCCELYLEMDHLTFGIDEIRCPLY